MAEQRRAVVVPTWFSAGLILRVVAFILFTVYAFVLLGMAHFQGDEAFIAWGLAALTLSFIVP